MKLARAQNLEGTLGGLWERLYPVYIGRCRESLMEEREEKEKGMVVAPNRRQGRQRYLEAILETPLCRDQASPGAKMKMQYRGRA